MMSHILGLLLLIFGCVISPSASASGPESCRKILGVDAFPRGWGLNSDEAVQLAQTSDRHRKQMVAATQAIRLLDAAPPEFFQLLAVVVPSFIAGSPRDFFNDLDGSRSPVERAVSEASANEHWQLTGLAIITRVLKISHPTWAGKLEATDLATKGWLSQAAMALPEFQPEPNRRDARPGQQLVSSLERFLLQQPLASSWAADFAKNSTFVRDQLAQGVIDAFERQIRRPVPDKGKAAQLARNIIDFYFDKLDQKRPELDASDKGAWMVGQVLHMLEDSLKADPSLQRKNFAVIFFNWAARIAEAARKEQELLVIGGLNLILIHDAADRILSELEEDRKNSSRFIPVLFSCMMASGGKGAKWPTPEQAKRFFYAGVQQQLRLMRSQLLRPADS